MSTTLIGIDSFGSILPPSLPVSNGKAYPAAAPVLRRPRPRWQFVSLAIAVALLALSGFGIFMTQPYENPAVIPAVQDVVPSTDWPNFRGSPGRTGIAAGTPISIAPSVVWQTNVGGRIDNPAVVAGGMIFAPGTAPNGLVALDAQTGNEVWLAPGVVGVPAVADDIVIAQIGTVDSTPNDLVALDARTGAQLWSHTATQDAGWSPVIDNGVLYLPALPNAMQALDVYTGETFWSTDLPGAVTKSVSLSEDLVIFGDTDGHLYALKRDTGEVVWTTPLSGGVIGVPSIAGGRIFVPIRDGDSPSLHGIELATGKQLWSYTGSTADVRYAAVSGETVYFPSLDGTLTALNAVDGTQKWQFQTNGPIEGSPVVVGGAVYQTSQDGYLYALDGATGKEIWTFALDGPSSVETPVVGNVIYVLTHAGSVYALSSSAASALATPIESATAVSSGSVAHVWTLAGVDEPFGNVPISAIDPQGRLWVADPTSNQIQIFDLDGTWLESWGESGSGPGQFNFVRDNGQGIGNIAFGPDGSFYVSEGGNRRVQKFDENRTFLTSWGGEGTEDGQFLSPFILRVSPDGNVFVMDDFRFDMQVFDADGAFLYKFGEPEISNGTVGDITSFTFGPEGEIYAVEGDNEIQVFDDEGTFLRTIISVGGGNMNIPADIVLDAEGNMYVANIGGNEITVFDPEGALLLKWGSFGSGDGQFNEPVQLLLRGGFVYVIEATGSRIQKFQVTLPES